MCHKIFLAVIENKLHLFKVFFFIFRNWESSYTFGFAIAKVAFKEDIWLICLKPIPFYLFQVMADAMHQLTRYRDALLLKVQGPSKNTEIIAQCHLVQPHIPEEKNWRS